MFMTTIVCVAHDDLDFAIDYYPGLVMNDFIRSQFSEAMMS